MITNTNTNKTVLRKVVALASNAKPVDSIGGTEIYADTYTTGDFIFAVNSDNERTPVPEGTYQTDGGLVITVNDAGRLVGKHEASAERERPNDYAG